jgi:methylase of polypeptide subunit release factors
LQLTIGWVEAGITHSARWQSEAGVAAPKTVLIADDSITADAAYRFACEGTAILWRGDFHNGRQLLQAMARRCDNKSPSKKSAKKRKEEITPDTPAHAFHMHRLAQAQRARILGMLLIQVEVDYQINLKRAPNVSLACVEAYGPFQVPFVVSLRELQGLIGAHEWRKKGVYIPSLSSNIHPHYGVFSPIRGEYLALIADAPLPSHALAFDIGTGTGVIAALLAKRGVKEIIATDQDPRALLCAQDNITRLGLSDQIKLIEANMFPEGKAPLVVCNPPWLPAKPSSPIEFAVYDPESQMLKAFLYGLKAHLTLDGEGWLVMSDFAEHLGLRAKDFLLDTIKDAGLIVKNKLDIQPKHSKVSDTEDRLHEARKKESTSLWILMIAS